jgi:hypothetical protein
MGVVSYQRILDGVSLSGKFGESLQATERWQVRVDSPTTTRLEILQTLATGGIVWGASHPEFSALKAMEFTLDTEGREGMRWMFTVKYYVPPVSKTPQANGIPKDSWERTGGTSTVPVFRDTSGESITNSAGDPLEGLEREREEVAWSLTKFYETDAAFTAAAAAYAGKVNSASWSSYDAKTVKCYLKGAKKVSVSMLDGEEDGQTLDYIESSWEFRYEPDTWKCKPWDVGFMEKVGTERKTITGSDGKPVKQPVALNSNGTKKTPGEKPTVINNGAGVDIYETANFTTGFGTPVFIPTPPTP